MAYGRGLGLTDAELQREITVRYVRIETRSHRGGNRIGALWSPGASR